MKGAEDFANNQQHQHNFEIEAVEVVKTPRKLQEISVFFNVSKIEMTKCLITHLSPQTFDHKLPHQHSHCVDLADPRSIHGQLLGNKHYSDLLDLIDKDQPEWDSSKAFCCFHLRKDELRRFRTGDIVGLDRDSRLVADNAAGTEAVAFLVVCDEYQKKLARCIPSHAQGHWCTAVGIARVRVDGAVAPGDLIRPKGDGSGRAVAAASWEDGPILGIALHSTVPRTGSFSPSSSSASSGALVSVLVSQDPSADPIGPADAGGSAAAPEATALMSTALMLERYVSLASAGDPVLRPALSCARPAVPVAAIRRPPLRPRCQ